MTLQMYVGHMQVPLVDVESNVHGAIRSPQKGAHLLLASVELGTVDCAIMVEENIPIGSTHAVFTATLVAVSSISKILQ